MKNKLSILIGGLMATTYMLTIPAEAGTAAPAELPAPLRVPPSVKGERQQAGSQLGTIHHTKIADKLSHPWSVAFLPDGNFLVTERTGKLRRITPQGEVSEPIQGVPKVFVGGHGGLLDVALAPDFKKSQTIYLSYSEGTDGEEPVGLTVATAKLEQDSLQDFKVIYRQEPKQAESPYWEFGGRFLFDGKGHVFITHGDNHVNLAPQQLDKLAGKVVRLNLDGSVPKDNPFVGRKDARPEVWSYGHRNAEGIGFHPVTGQIWTTDQGPRGGDELNIVQPGKNYGWPIVSYGVDYTGRQTAETKGPHRRGDGFEPPVYYWAKSPALSSLAFVTSDSAWKGNLLLGSLADKQLIRLELDGNKVIHEERLLAHLAQRIRDVRQGPDGFIYVLTDDPNGALYKIEPPTR